MTEEEEEEYDIISLFEKRNEEEEGAFHFEDIIVQCDDEAERQQQQEEEEEEDEKGSEGGVGSVSVSVTYIFSFSHHIKFRSHFSLNIEKSEKQRVMKMLAGHSHILFCIGMCALPWYWMSFGCRRIVIGPSIAHHCTSPVLQFWQHLYSNVLREYLFENNGAESPMLELSETFVGETVSPALLTQEQGEGVSREEVLLPIGGGKDSLVVWHLNKREGHNPDFFYVRDSSEDSPVGENWRFRYIARYAGKAYHTVEHYFGYDQLRRKGKSYLKPCGHPWAALCLFDAVLVAALKGHTSVQLGNERSADYGNGILHGGVEVNHQFDKSSTFLHAAAEYVSSKISADIRVTSPLEKLWDIEVASIFCKSPLLQPLHRIFMSCNGPLGNSRWCTQCEKCCFVYLVMSAFLPPPEVWGIFGDNLFERSSLEGTFVSLVGASLDGKKPFECVGTFKESCAAVELTFHQYIAYEKVFSISSQQQHERKEDNFVMLPKILMKLCTDLNILTADSSGGLSVHDEMVAAVDENEVIARWMSGFS